MLKESVNNQLEYQRLSQDEMEKRGILGRLVGVCADFFSPTRNGRKYPEELWEKVFESPIMKERIENGVCYGELGHPADREETDMEKIAVCLAEPPKKGSDGKLRAVFDILSTPNGKILKSLCDYGSTLGISSRGSGDLETDFDGNESVNPDTYNCEGFDIVLIPAVKEARLAYVTESLNKKRYNKTLRDRLAESINKEDENNQKIMRESLNALGIKLDEATQPDIYKCPVCGRNFAKKECTQLGGGIIFCPKCGVKLIKTDSGEYTEFNESLNEVNEELNNITTSYKNIDIEEKDGKFYCLNKSFNSLKNAKIYVDMQEKTKGLNEEQVGRDEVKPDKDINDVVDSEDNKTKITIEESVSSDKIKTSMDDLVTYLDMWYSDHIANEYASDAKEAGWDSQLQDAYLEFRNMLAMGTDNSYKPKNEAVDNGAGVDKIYESLKKNKQLERRIAELQEKLSVCYAKEISLNEELDSYKEKAGKLSNISKKNSILSEQLSTVRESKNKLTEQSQKLNESLKVKDSRIEKLTEQLNEAVSDNKAKNRDIEELTENYETARKDLTQLKEQYSKKIEQQNNIIEKYQKITRNAVNKYIDVQATRLGVRANEITNRLPESYSFNDIDRVCEDLKGYKLNIGNLPFNTSLNESMGLQVKNIRSNGNMPKNDIDEISDYDLKFAEAFM